MFQVFNKIFSKYQCGFRKSYSTQYCLLAMLEEWKKSIDNGKAFGASLTDLSKAVACLDHELLTAKLDPYDFSLPTLTLKNDYLSNRKRQTEINSSYSSWHDIIFGVPQGSILEPLLLNTFLSMFLIIEDLDSASYEGDSTPYMSANNIDGVVKSFEEASNNLFQWFSDNLVKRNASK